MLYLNTGTARISSQGASKKSQMTVFLVLLVLFLDYLAEFYSGFYVSWKHDDSNKFGFIC